MANEKFKINGVVSEVVPIVGDTGDVLKKTVSGVEWGALDKATQAEAEAGTNDTKIMTPLKVKQVTEQFATKTELANIDLTEELENLATKTELADKVDKVSGKQLSTNDYTTVEKNKLAGIEAGAQKNNVTSTDITNWNNKVDKVDGKELSTNDYTTTEKNKLAGIETGAQKNNVTSTDIANWNNKVDKVSGKQLSTNDYTTTEKNKLSGIQAGAEVNTVTSVNGQTGAVTTPNTTYDVATTTTNGLMSSADKTKLNGVEAGAEVNTVTSVNGQTGAVTTPNTTYNVATTTTNGLMSSSDKSKLNGVESGAQKNVALTVQDITNLGFKQQIILNNQAAYNALSTAQKNDTTKLYFIKG